MSAEIKQWLEGFSEHLIQMGEKYGSQSAYGREVTITPHFMSQIVNKRFQEFSKRTLLLMAERAGYDKQNHRHMCSEFSKIDNAQWQAIKAEVAVQYDNRRKDTLEFQGGVQTMPERISVPQDLYLIDRYINMRNTLPLSKTDQPIIRKALILHLCDDLQKLDERELC